MSHAGAATTTGDNGTSSPGVVAFSRPAEGTLLVRLAGDWKLGRGLPTAAQVQDQVKSGPPVRQVAFDAAALTGWDTGLLTFLTRVVVQNTAQQIETDQAGLPEGVRRLIALATAVPPRKDTGPTPRPPLLARVGTGAVGVAGEATQVVTFLGEAFLSFLKLLRGKARFRWSDLVLLLQECGAQAVPIVSLISFLVGVIIAYVGAVQLRMFAAQIYVADLVGIAMTRELGAIMASIIMAGRTGAAFAAELGTMQVNEEIDAFRTLGISAMEFLVVPRMLALALMMPLLCVYADLLGILGGVVVGVGTLDIGATEYYVRTSEAIAIADCVQGIIKASIFGVLVAIAGCYHGIRCGRSSAAVGQAATAAVVLGIVFIITSDACMTVIFNILGW